MYKGKRILALITARGGSKGIPGKNIKPLGGKPLINWTIEAAKNSGYIDRLIISTDAEAIAKIAEKAGCEVPFIRPTKLATDISTSMDVILHALDTLYDEYDYLVLLQPTSPFRKTQHIDSIIRQGIDTKSKITVSVTEAKKHPAFMFGIEDGTLMPVLKNGQHQRRQDMPKVYEHNGALYFAEIDYLKTVKSYNSEGVSAFEMGVVDSIDLDSPMDWQYAECILREGIIN
jgi:CMP-N-acetylneuraminic acid synthetase